MSHPTLRTRFSEPKLTVTLAPGQIPEHRWISFGNETLALSIDLTEEKAPLPTEIYNFHKTVELYSVYTKTCLVSVTFPEYSKDVYNSNHYRIFFQLVSIFNCFTRLSRFEVFFRMPVDNFVQLTNAGQFYRLDFKGWKLFRKVGSEMLEEIDVGSKTDHRLAGWYNVNIAGIPGGATRRKVDETRSHDGNSKQN